MVGENNSGGHGQGGQGQGQGAGQGAGQGQGQGDSQGQGAGQGAGQQGQGQGQGGQGQGQGQGGQGQGQGAGQGAGQQGQGQGQGAGQQGQDSKLSLKDIEAALGMPMAEAKALLAASKKPPVKSKPLEGADLKIAKMEALMRLRVPSEQIPVILQHLNITGDTAEEISASIAALIDAKILNLGGQGQQGQGQGQGGQGGQGDGQGAGQGGGTNANGAGNQGVQQQQQGKKKIWTAAEVRALRMAGNVSDEVLADIKAAMREGRVKE